MKKRWLKEYVSEIVYGGVDGVVTTFAIVAAGAGANLSTSVIFVLGFANLLADGFSMGVSAYLARKAEVDAEHKEDNHTGTPFMIGFSTFLAFVVVGSLPVLVYALEVTLDGRSSNAFLISSLSALLAFALVGYFKGRATKSSQARAVIETVLLGSIAAAIAYGVGYFLDGLVN